MILTSCYPKVPKKSPLLPSHEIWVAYGYGRSNKNSATTPPPPTESARLMAIPENFCYYPPPPTECDRLTAIPENFCYYPPPPPLNVTGLRRSRKISATTPPPHRIWSASGDHGKLAPPKKKSWLRRWVLD